MSPGYEDERVLPDPPRPVDGHGAGDFDGSCLKNAWCPLGLHHAGPCVGSPTAHRLARENAELRLELERPADIDRYGLGGLGIIDVALVVNALDEAWTDPPDELDCLAAQQLLDHVASLLPEPVRDVWQQMHGPSSAQLMDALEALYEPTPCVRHVDENIGVAYCTTHQQPWPCEQAPELPTAVGVNADGFVLAPPKPHGYPGAAGLADRAYADAIERVWPATSLEPNDVECEAYVLAIIDAFNPPDDDVAQVSILLDAIETAALFIESTPCTCDAPDGDPCDRCVALGRFADVRIGR